MFWTPPCGLHRPNCPYTAWLASPTAKLTRIRRYGHDRYDRQRFQCMLVDCGRTFCRPPDRADLIGFKAYMRIEVHLALEAQQPESFGMIACRLGVTRSTVVRWNDTWRLQEAAGTQPLVPRLAELRKGRLARLVQAREPGDAPYVVAPIDEEWFIQASVGEMRCFLANRWYPEEEADRSVLSSVSDRNAPRDVRLRTLQQFGQDIRQRFHEEVGLSARLAKGGGSPKTTR